MTFRVYNQGNCRKCGRSCTGRQDFSAASLSSGDKAESHDLLEIRNLTILDKKSSLSKYTSKYSPGVIAVIKGYQDMNTYSDMGHAVF